MKEDHWVSELEEELQDDFVSHQPFWNPTFLQHSASEGWLTTSVLEWADRRVHTEHETLGAAQWPSTLSLASLLWSYPTRGCQLEINSDEAGQASLSSFRAGQIKRRGVKWYNKGQTNRRCRSRAKQGFSDPQCGALCCLTSNVRIYLRDFLTAILFPICLRIFQRALYELSIHTF